MSRIDCGDGKAPCRCDCGHMSAWHITFQRWVARCLIPGCTCSHMDVCNCVEGDVGQDDDSKVLAALGITA